MTFWRISEGSHSKVLPKFISARPLTYFFRLKFFHQLGYIFRTSNRFQSKGSLFVHSKFTINLHNIIPFDGIHQSCFHFYTIKTSIIISEAEISKIEYISPFSFIKMTELFKHVLMNSYHVSREVCYPVSLYSVSLFSSSSRHL